RRDGSMSSGWWRGGVMRVGWGMWRGMPRLRITAAPEQVSRRGGSGGAGLATALAVHGSGPVASAVGLGLLRGPIHFLAEDADVGRPVDAEAHLAPAHLEDPDDDRVADADHLADLPCQDEHGAGIPGSAARLGGQLEEELPRDLVQVGLVPPARDRVP